MTTRTDHDVVVAGGRVAGAATARLLAAQGYDVVVLERATPYRDTLSTHGLSRGGVVQLARWGVLERLLAGGAPPIRAVTFVRPGEAVTRQVKDRAGVDLLLAPRRWALDAVLADAAVEVGARLETRTTVTDLLRGPDGRVTGVRATRPGGTEHEYHARLVVGADGLRSTVARLAGARLRWQNPSGAALFYAYVGEVPWPAMEFHLIRRGYGGAFPTHGGEACVWLTRPVALLQDLAHAGADRADAWLSALREVAPDLARRVGGGRIASPVRGWVGPPATLRQAQGPGWALVGDAGSFRDPITGHGITDALRDAELLAEAAHRSLSGEDPRALPGYEHARDTAAADVLRITGELTGFPDADRFVALQIELAAALDREATQLASRPAPAGRHTATAA